MGPVQLAVGTYDGYCAGLLGETLKRNFTFAAHQAILHSLTSAAGWLASGGGDETLHLFDAQRKADSGYVQLEADGALTAVAFVQPDLQAAPTHLLSGTSEGTICVNEVGKDWTWLLGMTGHSKAITGLSVHCSGKLVLSTARDGGLRMWNLAKGRCQYKTRLADVALDVQFAPRGNSYALVHGSEIQICDVGGAPALHLPHTSSRASCATFCGEQLLSGCENGHVHLWDAKAGKPAMSWSAHTGRLRGLAPLPSSAGPGQGFRAASAASNGSVRVWDLRAAAPDRPLAEVDLATRVTCLCVVDCQQRPEKHLAAGSRPQPTSKPSKGAGLGMGAIRTKADVRTGSQTDGTASRPVKRLKPKGQSPDPGASADQVGVAHGGVVEFPEPASMAKLRQSSSKSKKKKRDRQKA